MVMQNALLPKNQECEHVANKGAPCEKSELELRLDTEYPGSATEGWYFEQENRKTNVFRRISQPPTSKDGIINPHPFKFLHLPEDHCSTPPFLLIIVTSSAENLEARMAVRTLWGSKNSQLQQPVVFLFAFGLMNNSKVCYMLN